MWSGRTTIATRLSVAAIRSYCSQSALRRRVVALKMWRRARRSVSGSLLPEWTSSARPSKTRNPDHQSACDTSTEHRGSRKRFLNFARVSVMEIPTPPSRGYTVTMLSCGMPLRLNEVRTPCGLSWRNCSICGSNGVDVGMGGLPQRTAMREARLLAGDELQQRRLPAVGRFARSREGAGDVLGLLDALAPAAHRAPQVRVAPADVAGAVLVVRDDEVRDLDGHGRVVEHDGADRNPAAHGRLEVEPGHAEGGVAHEVDAELVGGGQLGADGEAEPGPERVRLAPAEIAARRDGAVERQQLVARAPRVVGDDGLA